MPILKVKNHSYNGEEALENVVNYALRSGYCGGLAVDPEHAVFQMQLVKQLWSKTDDTDYLHLHFALNTVSFVDGSKFSAGLSDYLSLRSYIQSLMPHWRVDLVSDC